MEAKRESLCKERIVDLEFKIFRLGILGKAYYELVQIKLKRHRTQITIAKTQNLLLHAALETLREKDRIARKSAGDLETLRKAAVHLRVTYDQQRQLVFKRQGKLEWQITTTHTSEFQCAAVLDPNTPLEVRIRSLEHRVAWIRLKLKDVQILVKHYETTVQSLRDEWVTSESKLAALQGHVNMKNNECEQLINTYHDAVRARDAAKVELEELLASLIGFGKKGLISPQLRSKILKAIKEIKVVMGVDSMRVMYHQYLLQEKQSVYLTSICEEMTRTIEQIKKEHRASMKRGSHVDKYAVAGMVEGARLMVRRQSSLKGSSPLLLILNGTQRLVDKLADGNVTLVEHDTIEKRVLEDCKERLVQILQAVHRKLRQVNKANAKREEFEAKQKAHWEKEEAEVARKNKAAEEARRKYEDRVAAKEAQREEAEKEMKRKLQLATKVEEQKLEAITANPSDPLVKTSSSASELIQGTSSGSGLKLGPTIQVEVDAESKLPDAELKPPVAEVTTVIFLPSIQHQVKTGGERAGNATDGQRADMPTKSVGTLEVEPPDPPSIPASSTALHTEKLVEVGLPIATALTSTAPTQLAEAATFVAEGIPSPTSRAVEIEKGIQHSSTLSADDSAASRQAETQQPIRVAASNEASAVQNIVEMGQATTVTSSEVRSPADTSPLAPATSTDRSVEPRHAESQPPFPGVLLGAEASETDTAVQTIGSASSAESRVAGTTVHAIGAVSGSTAAGSIVHTSAAMASAETSGAVFSAVSTLGTSAVPTSNIVSRKEREVEGLPGSPSTDKGHTVGGPLGHIALSMEKTSLPLMPEGPEGRPIRTGSPGLEATSSDERSATKPGEITSVESVPKAAAVVAAVYLPKDRSFTTKVVAPGTSDEGAQWVSVQEKTLPGHESLAGHSADKTEAPDIPSGSQEALPILEAHSKQLQEASLETAPSYPEEGMTPDISPPRNEASKAKPGEGSKADSLLPSIPDTGALTEVETSSESMEGAHTKPASPLSKQVEVAIAVSAHLGGGSSDTILGDGSITAKQAERTAAEGTPIRQSAQGFPVVESALRDHSSVVKPALEGAAECPTDQSAPVQEVATMPLIAVPLFSDARTEKGTEPPTVVAVSSQGSASESMASPSTSATSVDDTVSHKPADSLGYVGGQVQQGQAPTTVPVSSEDQPSQMSAEEMTVPVVLPRSPSGAPVATAAWSPKLDVVMSDDTGTPRSASGAPTARPMSPILPRSPSGAPVSTALRFPLAVPSDESAEQRQPGRRLSLSRPVSQASVGTEGLTDSSMPSAEGGEQR